MNMPDEKPPMRDDPRFREPEAEVAKRWANWEERVARRQRTARWLLVPAAIGGACFGWACSRINDGLTLFLLGAGLALIFPFHWMSSYLTRMDKADKKGKADV